MALSTKPPSGTRDFLAPAVRRRRQVLDTIRTAYERHGFEPLETPAFERIDTLTGKYGDEGDQLLFRILKRGQKLDEALAARDAERLVDFGLRYDLTVPLARVVAAHRGQLPAVYKRYQAQPVWRADRPQKGRFREFWQCDVDCVGTTSILAEVEVISAVSEALRSLGLHDFTIRLNDRRILGGLMQVNDIAPEREAGVLTIIDKLDKIGTGGVRSELLAGGLLPAQVDALLHSVAPATAEAESRPAELASFDALFRERSANGLAGVKRLHSLLSMLPAGSRPHGEGIPLVFDPSLARGLSYYTGPIFEIAVDGLAGSMGGGGRYDGLVGMFAGKEIPAVGFSLGFERLLVVLEERGFFRDELPTVDVLVALLDEDELPHCIRLARSMRRAGLRVDVQADPIKLGKQFRLAEERGIRFVAILGRREVESGTVNLKDLLSGEQTTVGQSECAASLRALRDTRSTRPG